MVQVVKKNEEPHYFFPESHVDDTRAYTNIVPVPVHPDTGRSYLLKPLPDENNLGTRSSLAEMGLGLLASGKRCVHSVKKKKNRNYVNFCVPSLMARLQGSAFSAP